VDRAKLFGFSEGSFLVNGFYQPHVGQGNAGPGAALEPAADAHTAANQAFKA